MIFVVLLFTQCLEKGTFIRLIRNIFSLLWNSNHVLLIWFSTNQPALYLMPPWQNSKYFWRATLTCKVVTQILEIIGLVLGRFKNSFWQYKYRNTYKTFITTKHVFLKGISIEVALIYCKLFQPFWKGCW